MIVKAIVDTSQFIHACHSVLSRKGDLSELPTLVLKNITNTISRVEQMFDNRNLDTVVLAVDSRPTFRHALYPEYKAHRASKGIDYGAVESALSSQFALLKHPKLEADDLMFLYASEHHGKELNGVPKAVMLITSDSDALQTHAKTGAVVFCPDKMTSLKLSDPNEWKLKLLLGDESDNVKRVAPPRQGPAKLLNALKTSTVAELFEKFGVPPMSVEGQIQYKLLMYDERIYNEFIPDLEVVKKLIQKL